ncbi:S41 family peptidase [Pseudoalteromonas phenolica]|uniref:S41 family peptidase n=1 Tax=Pseudoalteromonas phenolica TaxID=161398 RepID=UPI0038509C3A
MKNCLISKLLLTSLSVTASNLDVSRAELIVELQTQIAKNYVDVNKVEHINNSLTKISPEVYSPLSNEQFISLITKTLEKHDAHFSFQEKPDQTKKQPAKESWFSRLSRSNSGFNSVENLKGGVGYFDFWGFDSVNDKSRKRVSAVMQLVSDSQAIIIDLRNNGGGSAEMVQLISSYFLEGKVHLTSFYSRPSDSRTEFWTFSDIPAIFKQDIPVYILTSKRTFSAAEEFAYNFKHLKRATLIGEKTKGGANPWQWFEVGASHRVAVPTSMAINPITQTNWEGIGVKPDINTFADSAFDIAYQKALLDIKSKTKNRFLTDEINIELSKLEKKQQQL